MCTYTVFPLFCRRLCVCVRGVGVGVEVGASEWVGGWVDVYTQCASFVRACRKAACVYIVTYFMLMYCRHHAYRQIFACAFTV